MGLTTGVPTFEQLGEERIPGSGLAVVLFVERLKADFGEDYFRVFWGLIDHAGSTDARPTKLSSSEITRLIPVSSLGWSGPSDVSPRLLLFSAGALRSFAISSHVTGVLLSVVGRIAGTGTITGGSSAILAVDTTTRTATNVLEIDNTMVSARAGTGDLEARNTSIFLLPRPGQAANIATLTTETRIVADVLHDAPGPGLAQLYRFQANGRYQKAETLKALPAGAVWLNEPKQ
jgi:hypothetical protein